MNAPRVLLVNSDFGCSGFCDRWPFLDWHQATGSGEVPGLRFRRIVSLRRSIRQEWFLPEIASIWE